MMDEMDTRKVHHHDYLNHHCKRRRCTSAIPFECCMIHCQPRPELAKHLPERVRVLVQIEDPEAHTLMHISLSAGKCIYTRLSPRNCSRILRSLQAVGSNGQDEFIARAVSCSDESTLPFRRQPEPWPLAYRPSAWHSHSIQTAVGFERCCTLRCREL